MSNHKASRSDQALVGAPARPSSRRFSVGWHRSVTFTAHASGNERVVRLRQMGYAARHMTSAVTTLALPTDLNLRADMTFASRSRLATADIAGGVRLWRLALALGWLDIRLRYRGSMLGP